MGLIEIEESEYEELKSKNKELTRNLSSQRKELEAEFEEKYNSLNTEKETLAKDLAARDEAAKTEMQSFKDGKFTTMSKGDKDMETRLRSAYDELAIDDSSREGAEKRLERAYQLAGGVQTAAGNFASETAGGTPVLENMGGMTSRTREVLERTFKQQGLDTAVLDNTNTQ